MQPFIGSRIRHYRSMAGKTQEQLSVELDVTKQHLGLIERGECNPSLDLLKRACQTLGVSPANFFLGCMCKDDVCASEEQLGDDTQFSPVSTCGTWSVRLSDSRISWSGQFCRFLGESPSARPSLKKFLKHVPPRFHDAFLDFYAGVLSGRKAQSLCCAVASRNGAQRAIQIQADIVPGAAGPEEMALFSFLDVTDERISRQSLLHNQRHLETIVQEKTRSLRSAAEGLQEELERRSLAEQLVREQSEQIERLVEAVPAIIYEVALDDCRCRYFSLHARRILGESLDGGVADGGLPWHDRIHPDDAGLVAERFRTARTGKPFVIEYRIRDKFSRWRWFRDEGAPKAGADGRPILHGVVTDITGSKMIEAELEKSRAMLMEAEAMAGLGCVELDLETGMWDVSDNWCRLTGSSGRRISSREMLGFVPPDERFRVKRALVRAMKSGTYNVTHRLVRQDTGAIIHVHGYGKIDLESGRATRLVGAVHDITVYREMSDALMESEKNFRTFFETVDDIFLIADDQGRILHANHAAVAKTKYPLENLRTMHVLDLHDPSRQSDGQAMFEAMMRGERQVCDMPLVSRDGQPIPTEARIWFGTWNGRPCVYCISKEQFRISSTMLRLICDNVPDMIWAKDMQKRYIFANTALCRNLLSAGGTEEPLGKNDMFFAERERSRFADNPEWHTFGEICRDTDQITMDAGCPQQFDEYGNVQGRFMFLDVHKAPLYDDRGIMIGTVGSAREVTEQRRMAEALETTNKTLFAVLDSFPAEVYVADLKTHRILFMNRTKQARIGRDCTGEICHEAFRHSPVRCPFCTSPDLLDWDGNPVGIVTWECLNPVSGRWYMNHDQAIVWTDGSMARIQIAVDITGRKEAEEALRTERDLFSEGPVMTIVWEPSPGWPVRYVSANVREVLGYLAQEITDGSFLYDSLIHPEDLARVREEVEANLQSGCESFTQSYRLRTKGGEYIWICDFTKMVRSVDGTVTSICGYMFDQTHVKRLEHDLAEERERLAGIIDGTNVGTWEWNVMTGETIFNERWAEIIGYSLEDLGPVSIETWMRLTHPGDLKKTMLLLEQHFDSESIHYEAEFRMRHRDGRWIWVQGRGKVSSWTPDGRPVIMRGTNQDITARKQAEEELRRANLLLQSIFDALPGSLNVVDTQYNVLRSNRARHEQHRRGKPAQDAAEGGKCFEKFQNRRTPCPWCKVGDVIATGEPRVAVADPGDPRTAGRPFHVHLNPVKDDAGNLVGVVEYGFDISVPGRAGDADQDACASCAPAARTGSA